MENKMSFREYVKAKRGSRRPNYSYQRPIDYTIMSILADKTFPENEADGMEISNYIFQKQHEATMYDRTDIAGEYNQAVRYCFERLWKEYKEYLKHEQE